MSAMKLNHTPDMTFDSMAAALAEELPQYEVELKKNPLLGFRYVEVRKSGFVGVQVRVFEKKNEVRLINGIPAWWARAFFGGLLFIAFVWGSMQRVNREVGAALTKRFGATEK